MSHRPPPVAPPSGPNPFNFSPLGVVSMGPDLPSAQVFPSQLQNRFTFASTMADSPAQMAVDPHDATDMMALLDSSVFDLIPMNLDNDDGTIDDSFGPLLDGEAAVAADSALASASAEGGPGAGPGAESDTPAPSVALGPNSMVTEFTKRRNWPARIVEELKDLLQILDANGRIKYLSPNVEALTGYAPEDLLDKLVRDLIHPDDVGLFVSEMNEAIAQGSSMRMFYRFRTKSGSYIIFESVGHAHIASARFAPNPHNQSAFCQAVFMMSRPYPTRNAALLDSFLEHKIENERLRRRIAELRQEEEADAEDAQRQWALSQEGRSEITMSEDTMGTSTATGTLPLSTTYDSSMPPPEKPSTSNAALTRENLEGAVAGSRPDSLRDKMARYEGSSHTDTIELLTGLKYIQGERSRGITTGNSSPTLIRGDAGIPIPPERDPRTTEKSKKKQKTIEEYVCTDCGTLDSPEWRKGPTGPKTLCNACGLRWAKKEKKQKPGPTGPSAAPTPAVEQSA